MIILKGCTLCCKYLDPRTPLLPWIFKQPLITEAYLGFSLSSASATIQYETTPMYTLPSKLELLNCTLLSTVSVRTIIFFCIWHDIGAENFYFYICSDLYSFFLISLFQINSLKFLCSQVLHNEEDTNLHPFPHSLFLFLSQLSVQFSSVAQSCLILCDPMNCSTPGLPVHHQLPEFTQIHVHWVGDAIQPSHPLSSPSPPAPNPSQHQSLFQWVNSSHEVAKVLEFQL